MNTTNRLAYVAVCLVGLFGNRADAQTVAKFTRQSDVIYGRKFGAALTMEVSTPATRNGLGVVWVASSGGSCAKVLGMRIAAGKPTQG